MAGNSALKAGWAFLIIASLMVVNTRSISALQTPSSGRGGVLSYHRRAGQSPEWDNFPKNSSITTQNANFVINYNPAGGCATSGLPNFIPAGTLVTWPQAAKDAFAHALSLWAAQLHANQTIVIRACWLNPGGANPLGTGQPVSAFANFTNAPIGNTLYVAALANEFAGADLNNNDGPDHDGDGNDADAEIIVAFNSTTNWYFGTDGNPPGGQLDFVTTALHEVAHGLGFVSTFAVDSGIGECSTGNSGDGCWGVGTGFNGMPAIFDRFVENGSGQSLLNTTPFPNPSSQLGSQLVSNNVFFNGPNAKAENGGTLPKLYAPNPFELGSSILHLDQNTYNGTANQLMIPSSTAPQHQLGPLVIGIFRDMGWKIGIYVYLPIIVVKEN